MQNYQFLNNSIVHLDFSDEKTQLVHVHPDIEMFYVLEGEIAFSAGVGEYILQQDDFIVINPLTEHSHRGNSNVLYACFFINYSELCRRLDSGQIILSCNSTLERSKPYVDIQSIIRDIFNQNSNSTERESFILTALHYQLLHILINHFQVFNRPSSLPHEKEVDDTRMRDIQNFLRNNYKNPITLEDLARHLFLSPAYLSKYIKKHFQMNYTNLLSNIRFSLAVEDIKHTDKLITRISQDNGFPNMASFNRLFRAKFGMTSSAYAAKIRLRASDKDIIHKNSADLTQKVHDYFESQMLDKALDKSVVWIHADTQKKQRYSKSWNRMINIGRVSDLLNFDMREQILAMKKELEFEYVRIWDIYTTIIFLEDGQNKSIYNFTKLDRIFDFFIDNGMRPYIELGFKPVLVLRSTGSDFLVSQQREILFENPAEYEHFVLSFITNYSNRFGLDEVEKWFFEQWIDPRQTEDKDYCNYFEMFEAAYRALKSSSPKINIGGGGLSVKNNDRAIYTYFKTHGSESKNLKSEFIPQSRKPEEINSEYQSLLNAWRKRPYHPDFFSMYCYPYTDEKQIQNLTSMKEQVLVIRDAVDNAGFSIPEFHISEWNFTASDRNILNDSCLKSAYIVKNVLENMQLADIMGYWYASDLMSESTDTTMILNGSGGLISIDGIKKPSYYAFYFLNKMDKYLLCNEDHCAITNNGRDNYTIICHNHQEPNYKYLLRAEDEISISEYENLFESGERLRIQFQINNVKNGSYLIKTHSLNNENGSAQREWVKMGLLKNMNKKDIDYLKRICTPRISAKKCVVKDNVLLVDTMLDVQEIQYIHLTYTIEP